jgi:cytoskeletal protein CcmA (bactofilin family)
MPLFGRQHVRLPMMNWNQVAQRPESRNASTTREMDCPFCGETLRVPVRALNTRCTNCTRHLRLEDIVVRGDSPVTRIVTCGTILVEPTARFSGVLQASHIIVAGRVMGTVVGTQRVEVTSTGKVAGTIATRDLVCDPHALIDGQINILNVDGTVQTLATGQNHQPPKYRPGD